MHLPGYTHIPETYRAAVLLSAYGASPFLKAQLASIRAALTNQDILIIVDDGSKKVDWSPLDAWPYHYLCWSRLDGMGSSASFMDLLMNAPVSAKYYCWADQDDIWGVTKLQRQIVFLQENPHAWACVHGWRLLQHDGSQWVARKQFAPVQQYSTAHYCFETPAPGMTLCLTEVARQQLHLIDATLLKRLLADMPHDRLVCAILGVKGRIYGLPDALVDYRQHAKNQIGAPVAGWLRRFLKRVSQGARILRTISVGRILYQQLMMHKGSAIAPSLPPLAGQILRSNKWEDRLLRVYLRWRA